MSLHNSSDILKRNQKWIFYSRACKRCEEMFRTMQDNTSRNERGPTEVEGFLLSASNASAGILCVFQTSVAKQSTKSADTRRDRTSDGLCKQ